MPERFVRLSDFSMGCVELTSENLYYDPDIRLWELETKEC